MIGSLAMGGASCRAQTGRPLSAVVRAPSDPGFAVLRLAERGRQDICRGAETIEIGQTFGNSIEVLSGLQAGDRVIVLGARWCGTLRK